MDVETSPFVFVEIRYELVDIARYLIKQSFGEARSRNPTSEGNGGVWFDEGPYFNDGKAVWRFFFQTQVLASRFERKLNDSSSCIVMPKPHVENISAVHNWCYEHCTTFWNTTRSENLAFFDVGDAALFKLTWL